MSCRWVSRGPAAIVIVTATGTGTVTANVTVIGKAGNVTATGTANVTETGTETAIAGTTKIVSETHGKIETRQHAVLVHRQLPLRRLMIAVYRLAPRFRVGGTKIPWANVDGLQMTTWVSLIF